MPHELLWLPPDTFTRFFPTKGAVQRPAMWHLPLHGAVNGPPSCRRSLEALTSVLPQLPGNNLKLCKQVGAQSSREGLHVGHPYLMCECLDLNPNFTLHSSCLLRHTLREATGDGSNSWAPVTHMAELAGIPGSKLWPLQVAGERITGWKLYLCVCLSLFLPAVKKISK